MKIVSACLAGIPCRYDGKAKPCIEVMELINRGDAIPVCPEQLGGLPTPREPAEQQGNKVITTTGKDVTTSFEKGAQKGLRIAQEHNCTEAILKSHSPSCGSGTVYDGTFTGTLIEKDGVFAAALKKEGINVKTEKHG